MVENGNSSYTQPSILKYVGHYDHWAMLMENLLGSKEYWNIVEGGVPTMPATPTPDQRKNVEESKLKDLKANKCIFQLIERNIIETVLDKDSSKTIWDSMKHKYQGSTKVKRAQLQALRKEFRVLAMKEGEIVDEYLARALEIATK